MSPSVRVSNPVIRDGEKILVTTAKGSSLGNGWASAIKRTIKGENAELQIETVADASENHGIVHLHCLSDKAESEYSRNKIGKIEELYEIHEVLRIKCKHCGREWFNDGFNCESHGNPNIK